MGPPQNFVWTLAQCARAYFREAPASAQEGLDLHVVLHILHFDLSQKAEKLYVVSLLSRWGKIGKVDFLSVLLWRTIHRLLCVPDKTTQMGSEIQQII